MPETLPSVLRRASEASGNTCALKYSSVTPQTWYDGEYITRIWVGEAGEGIRCSQAFIRKRAIATGIDENAFNAFRWNI